MKRNSNPLITVVIPVYNVETYLERCLDSVLKQSYQNLEIILVDDGSTDTSGDICRIYAGRDKRIRVIYKQNGGLSDARNTGIEQANGKYITFIDSDDSVSDDYVEYLYSLITKYRVNIAVAAHKVLANDKPIEDLGLGHKSKKLSAKNALRDMCIDNGLTVSAWAKMYATSLFAQVRYPKGLIYEDIGTTYKLVLQCKYIAYGPKSIYNYYKQAGTITTESFSPKKLSYISLADMMCDEIIERYPDLRPYTLNKRVEARFSILRQIYSDRAERKYEDFVDEITTYFRQNKQAICQNTHIKRKYRLSLALLGFSKNLFKYLCRAYYDFKYQSWKSISNKSLLITITITLFCCYIFPTGIVSPKDYRMSKLIFIAGIGLQYAVTILKTKQISLKEVILLASIFALTAISRDFSLLSFVPLIYLLRIRPTTADVKEIFSKTDVLYLCLFATIIYSLVYVCTGNNSGRFAFAAIREINQSGLAIFCLGCMLLIKHRKIGLATLAFGLLSLSRSYYLAVACLVIFHFVRRTKFGNALVKYCSYLNLTIVSSVILMLVGVFYFWQYKAGNIIMGGNDGSRIFNLLDYSNFFRFQANILLAIILTKSPKFFLTGISDEAFNKLAASTAKELSLPYRTTPPHNLFFSHLKKYGFFSLIETVILSLILRRVVNKENFGVYIAIIFYSILLGAGLYSYWLYLSFATLSYFSPSINKTRAAS